jgi:hypothetical protein
MEHRDTRCLERLTLAILLLSTAACRQPGRSPRDLELETAIGMGTFTSWQCTPDGPRSLRSGLRRGEYCLAQRREGDMSSLATVWRDPEGHVIDANRSWGLIDSVRWANLRDSVVHAFAGRIKTAPRCLTGQDSAMAASRGYREEVSMWHLPRYDLLILTTENQKPMPPLRQLRIQTPVLGFRVCEHLRSMEASP